MIKDKSPLRQKDIRQGEKQERERIIALIKNSVPDCMCADVGMTWCRHNETELRIIELIEGENNA